VLDLRRLTPEQRRVVLAPDGPLLVVAGPGAGKTTVLAARAAYLVAARHAPPATVLALTFTAAAARQLRARLVGVLGEPGRAVEVGTFHSFGLRVVRCWPGALGYADGRVRVYDQADAAALLREAAGAVGLDASHWRPADLRRALERHRLGGVTAAGDPPLAPLADAYEALLRRRGAVDYPAMLALPLRLLDDDPPVRSLLQGAYRHVLADEFQDVCPAQYRLLRVLAERHRSLVAVGDAWQALFQWRGADARFLDEFRRDFPEGRVLALSENFRASGQLVALANAIGAPLGERRLWTRNPPGRPAVLHAASDERAEAAFVADEVARLRADGLVESLSRIAVLYRTNRQAGEVALALRARGLPYRVRGGGDLLARREVRDAVAYLRLAHDPTDGTALARIVDVPPRRLGRLAELVRTSPCTASELPSRARRLGAAAADRAGALASLIEMLHEESRRLHPAALLDLVLERSGYRAWLEGRPDGAARLAHLAGLRELAVRAGRDLADWLDELRLGEEPDAAHDGTERVLLSTVHLAKGGEWTVVFVLGVEEGLLPHARALAPRASGGEGAPTDAGSGLAEELKVAYVAVTRPCDRLYLTFARTRRRGERTEARQLSRFVRGLPAGLLSRAA
jgi:DNA helicase-2/ATP-dependent DNA helicase PcrA